MIKKALWQGHAPVFVKEHLESSEKFDLGFKSVKIQGGPGRADRAVGWKGVCIDTIASCSASCNLDVLFQPRDDEVGVVMQGWLEKCGQQFKTCKW